MKIIISHIVIISLMLSVHLSAQVAPPEIKCITADTIFYTPINNSCGAFISYDIFIASDATGPFSLLESVVDPVVDFYEHANSSSQIIFYFIVPNFDCPGEPIMNSDTISNRPPEVAILQTVDVDNSEAVLSWDLSPSPEASTYTVFFIGDNGLEFVGQTPNTTFTDTTRDPNQISLSYLIAANDACGNQSIFGDEVASTFLTGQVDPCDGSGSFDWNMHTNATRQELWAISTDGTEILIDLLPDGAESHVTNNLPNIELTGFFIRAIINDNEARVARSNVVNLLISINLQFEEIFFTEVNTIDENTIALEWCWNENVALDNYEIVFNSAANSNSRVVPVFNSITPIVNEDIAVTNTGTESYTIFLNTTDNCDRLFISSDIKSIALSVNPIDENNLEVVWSEFEYQDATLLKYVLHEVKNGQDNIVFEGLATSFVQQQSAEPGQVCYFVLAIAEGFLNDGSQKNTRIQSNLACSNGFPIIRLPNAFNPYGINSIFRPLFGNTDAITSYEMNIFSRYGERLFFTNNLDQGWNGRDGLREMPQGVYSYVIRVDVLGGESIVRQGSVLLIR